MLGTSSYFLEQDSDIEIVEDSNNAAAEPPSEVPQLNPPVPAPTVPEPAPQDAAPAANRSNNVATNDQNAGAMTKRLVPGELVVPETEVRWGDSPWILYGFFENLTHELSRYVLNKIHRMCILSRVSFSIFFRCVACYNKSLDINKPLEVNTEGDNQPKVV